MTLPAPIDLTEWFDRRVQKFLVLTPTSTSPQPVHVLNGLLHHSLTGRRASKTAVDLVATRSGGGWAVGNKELREKSPLTLPSDDLKLDKARRAVGALIAADRAVFAGGFASFQIAHLGLITSDSTHHHLGDLSSRLLLSEERGRATLQLVIERLAAPQPNPHWAIESILSDPSTLDELSVREVEPVVPWWIEDPRCAAFRAELSDLLIRALRLASEKIDSLLAIETVAVTATWVGLLTYSQVPSLCLGDGLATLLVQASEPGDLASVRQSSAAVIDHLDGTFQAWIAELLFEDLRAAFGDDEPEDGEAIKYLHESKASKTLSGGRPLEGEALEGVYKAWRHDHTPLQSMARAMQDNLTASLGNKARDWFAAVGRSCGFVGPRRGNLPRLRAEVSLVPTLILAGLADDDGPSVPFDEWALRVTKRFGIVVGPNESSRAMNPRASEDELLRNQTELAALMTSLGLARRYSDGVTEVLNPFHLWKSR